MYGYDGTSEPQFQGPDDRNSEISVQEPRQSIPVPVVAQPTQPLQDVYRLHYNFPKHLFDKLRRSILYLIRVEVYGNMIPLGSFCFAITFIIYGFYRCKVFTINETFIWAMIFYFGAIGQLTAGFLEYIRKNRTFPATVYTVFGGYCLSHYYLYMINKYNLGNSMTYQHHQGSVCAFYSAWLVITFAVLIASVKTNLFYILQLLCTFVAFLLRAIGEGTGSLGTKRNAAGILQVIAGFFSLIIFMSQVLNKEIFQRPVFPTMPMGTNNID